MRRRLKAFRCTHPYQEIQVAGNAWRSIIGGQGERVVLLLPGSLVPDLFFAPIQALEYDSRVLVPAYAAVSTMSELIEGGSGHPGCRGGGARGRDRLLLRRLHCPVLVRAHPARVARLILAETGVRHFVSWAPSI